MQNRTLLRDRVWLIGAALLTVFPLLWFIGTTKPRITPPMTPMANVNHELHEQWLFLQAIRPHIPAGASYTVVSRDTDSEMGLFMLSLGILTESRPVPTTYYRMDTPHHGRTARFVIAFGGARPPADVTRVVARTPWGNVYERVR